MSFSDPRGSVWRRWDPHIHAPGTALNDQYGGNTDAAWESFLTKLESAAPNVEALGVTDYYRLDGYKAACEYKSRGRLPGVELIFPNVEIRLGIGTSKGGVLNAHLLFLPEDPNHISQIESFLGKLQFNAFDENFSCTEHDLRLLGRRFLGSNVDDGAALAAGINQFKVDFKGLKDLWKSSSWLASNCLFAVAVGEKDGTSGLRDEDGSLASLRKDIERFASVIFSSQQSQIEFFLGRKCGSRAEFEEGWGGFKPCLHGSDAHKQDRVANPDLQRYCWIKGDPTFDALRHACMEPEMRVAIGADPPGSTGASRIISRVTVNGLPWMDPHSIPLNSGLVAIIGARGSGKTALADLIAAGGFAARGQLNPSSFLVRAKDHLEAGRVEIQWVDGKTTGNELAAVEFEDLFDSPRVQYLSQQFVETLCSSEGAATALVDEIHRVMFDAHEWPDREGANSFDELLKIRLEPILHRRRTAEEKLEAVMSSLQRERQLRGTLPQLEKRQKELISGIQQDERERSKLINNGREARAQRYEQVQKALDNRQQEFEAAKARVRDLTLLSQDVHRFLSVDGPNQIQAWRDNRTAAGLNFEEWGCFKVKFVCDVEALLQSKISEANGTVQAIAGNSFGSTSGPDLRDSPNTDAAELRSMTLKELSAEVERVGKLITADKQSLNRLQALNAKLSSGRKELDHVERELKAAETADGRIAQLLADRRAAYESIFHAVSDVEVEYGRLYGPLEKRIKVADGALARFGISVKRVVDIIGWVSRGEDLLDLRKQGPFRGKGVLLEKAREALLPAWQSGLPSDIASAMYSFAKANEEGISAHKPDSADTKVWRSEIAAWLHDASHIKASYVLTYSGIEIGRLSPGTRGVVLLLLYLALDEDDDRPLIIDQPEENLDPKSVYDELVAQFRRARTRRQVIIVTHNANLVVNTDADQVIVAEASGHAAGKLPDITYVSGGLENCEIRRHVCNILEGGERAFRDRANRLRLSLASHKY